MCENKKIKEFRKKIFLTAYAGDGGQIPSALSLVEILYTLYNKKILKYDPMNISWEGRDRLILSKGHGALALYVALADVGFFDEKTLYSYGRCDSILALEPNVLDIPGVEASTGSLGHGLSMGIGMALSHKLDKVDNKVFVVLGDGECQEGSIWEGIMSAKALALDNLIVILDANKLQKMDTVENIIAIDDWKNKLEAFEWDVHEVDGHNVEEISNCLENLGDKGRPHFIIAHTIKGKGVSFMENAPGWHYKMPNSKQLKKLMEELEISQEDLDNAKNLHQHA